MHYDQKEVNLEISRYMNEHWS